MITIGIMNEKELNSKKNNLITHESMWNELKRDLELLNKYGKNESDTSK